MLILASNQPDQFDWAVNDRLDDLVRFSLPRQPERLRMLKLYFSLYILDPPRASWWRRPRWVGGWLVSQASRIFPRGTHASATLRGSKGRTWQELYTRHIVPPFPPPQYFMHIYTMRRNTAGLGRGGGGGGGGGE